MKITALEAVPYAIPYAHPLKCASGEVHTAEHVVAGLGREAGETVLQRSAGGAGASASNLRLLGSVVITCAAPDRPPGSRVGLPFLRVVMHVPDDPRGGFKDCLDPCNGSGWI